MISNFNIEGVCPTCSKSYYDFYAGSLCICSNSFHRCRDCKYDDGKIMQYCTRCLKTALMNNTNITMYHLGNDLELGWNCSFAFIGEAIRVKKLVEEFALRYNEAILFGEVLKKDKSELVAQISKGNDLADGFAFDLQQVTCKYNELSVYSKRQSHRIVELDSLVSDLKKQILEKVADISAISITKIEKIKENEMNNNSKRIAILYSAQRLAVDLENGMKPVFGTGVTIYRDGTAGDIIGHLLVNAKAVPRVMVDETDPKVAVALSLGTTVYALPVKLQVAINDLATTADDTKRSYVRRVPKLVKLLRTLAEELANLSLNKTTLPVSTVTVPQTAAFNLPGKSL